MASLQKIQTHLNIEINNEQLCNGKKQKDKNQYYYYKNQYYIVQLTQNKWCVLEDCTKTRKLLKQHVWRNNRGYAQTTIGTRPCQTTKKFHQLFLTYEDGLVCDHLNNKRFDNRSENLRIVSYSENNRNRTTPKNNTSGKQGVVLKKYTKRGFCTWQSTIYDNNHNRIKKEYSIKKYGYDQAKELAIAWRKQKELELGYSGD
jgi:hypothetical protein